MANLDGQPVLLEVGETSANGQQCLVVGGVDRAGLGQLARMTDAGTIAVGHIHEGQEVWADFHKEAMTDGAYHIFLELNYVGGQQYRHTGGSYFVICSGTASAVKSAAADVWLVRVGVIVRINGTDADIAWLHSLDLSAHDPATTGADVLRFGFDQCVNLQMTTPPNFDRMAVGDIETAIAAVNTGLTLPEISGVARTPAVGDVVMRPDRTTGAGTIDVSYSVQYLSVII